MTPDLVNSSVGLLFTLFYVAAIIVIPIILGNKFLKAWRKYARAKFFAGEKYTLLEIKIPKNNTKSPVAMEIVFNALYQGGKDYEFKKKYISGEVRPWFSLEICSFDGTVHFYIWTKTKFKELLENQLYSQYSDIEINDVSSFGFITGIFVSYGLNRIYTFSDPSIDMKNEFAAYVVVCIFSLLLSLASLWVFVELFGINPLIGNVLAIGVSTVSNFLGLKTFVYSN